MRWIPPLALGALLTAGLTGALSVACSSGVTREPASDDPVDASEGGANLPNANDASSILDAAAEADAAEPDVTVDAAIPDVECDAGSHCATRLAAGDRHLCALMADGTVRCWGDNTKGAVGLAITDGDAEAGADLRPGIAPRVVADISSAKQVSIGDDVSCALLEGGGAKCWGGNDLGQLGLSSAAPKADTKPHPEATPVDITERIAHLEVGHGSVCARLESGAWSCWGANTYRQLLSGATTNFGGPAPAGLGALSLARIASGSATFYGIADDARLFSWGLVSGRDTSFSLDPAPKENPYVGDVIDVAAGPAQVDFSGKATFHTCVLTSKARVYCWGASLASELPALCTGVPNDRREPTRAWVQPVEKGTAYAQQIAAGRLSTCVRLTDGSVQCCGDDTRGQIGTGAIAVPPAVLSFTPAKALTGHAVQVVTARFATCALMRDGQVQCWGGNKYGELGQGAVDTDPHPVPVKVQL